MNIDLESPLTLEYSHKELQDEFFWYLDHPEGTSTLICNKNKIIKYYQQDIFYKKEKELWCDPEIRNKLIENRKRYLNKTEEELTVNDILTGFKKSAIYYGYSGFNPQLCKYFYKHIINEGYIGCNMHDMICYDPCGGWGHRMLGSTEVNYIYNDIDSRVVENIRKISRDFDFFQTTIYNHDAREFIPEESFNVMFTCPPYYNIEVYNDTPYENIKEYNDLLDSLFDIFNMKESCKVFGMVIREDLLPIRYIKNAVKKISLKTQSSYHLTKKNTKYNQEYLYIFIKI